MTPTDEKASESSGAPPAGSDGKRARKGGASGAFGEVARFMGRHPLGVLQALAFALVAVIVLQNLDPMRIEVLFWSVPEVPKLVLILIAMLLGAALWEVLRRALRRRGKRA